MSHVFHFIKRPPHEKLDLKWTQSDKLFKIIKKLREQEEKVYEKTRLWTNETAPD